MKSMWVVAMFDLPTETKKQKKAYALFRKELMKDGFRMMQFSVYFRHCPSEENAEVHCNRVKGILPDKGEVRVLTFTDKQFGRMKIYYGRMCVKNEEPPEQLSLF